MDILNRLRIGNIHLFIGLGGFIQKIGAVKELMKIWRESVWNEWWVCYAG